MGNNFALGPTESAEIHVQLECESNAAVFGSEGGSGEREVPRGDLHNVCEGQAI